MRTRIRFLAVIVPALAAFPLSAQMSRAEQIAIIDSTAESPLVEGRVAGLAVAVVQGNDTLLMKSYGRANLEWDVPMPLDAVFEIGSVTKQFTAAAILKLRDQGKLDLDADMRDYLPDFDTQGHTVPLRRLLDHTSGIQSYTDIAAFAEIRTRNLSRDTLVKRVEAEPFVFPPGEALIYNNSAYFFLGLIIEEVSGVSYEEFIHREFFEPLGMDRSSYCSNSTVVPRRAQGYNLTLRGLEKAPYVDHVWPYSAGSLCSTVGDLITWLDALHGGRVLPDASYRDMITPEPLNDGTPTRYAKGLSVAPDTRGRPAIAHGGGIFGFVSDTRYYPEHDLKVVTLVNTTGNLSPAALAQEFVDVLIPRVQLANRNFEGDRELLVGTYTGPGRGRDLTFTVSMRGNRLMVGPRAGRPAPMSWVEDWTFRVGAVRRIMFERDGNTGPATIMRVDEGGGHFVLRRQPG